MIPTILMVLGALASAGGLILLGACIISPFRVKLQSINGQEHVAETGRTKRKRNSDRKDLTLTGALITLGGAIIFGAGWYLGFADRGNGNWLYNIVYGKEEVAVISDKITEDGKYIAEDGKTYTYYIRVRGREYEFCNKKIADLDELEEKLSGVGSENTIVLIDSYAVSAEYNAARKLIREKGFRCEMEEE